MNLSLSQLDIPAAARPLLSDAVWQAYPTGRSADAVRAACRALAEDDLFAAPVRDRKLARGAWAGLWLLHGCWDESHELSQSLDTPEGSHWHAIMHRLEGDYGNSKYWYRQVGSHPVWEQLQQTLGSDWSPTAFVDRCQRSDRGTSATEQAEVHHQARLEWQVLFTYCWQQAQGKSLAPT
jgi:hypothetical protein